MPRAVLLLLLSTPALVQAAAVPVSHLAWAKQSQGRFAYGIYFKDQKVGWIVEEMKLGTLQGKQVLFSSSHTMMVTLFDGEKSVKEEKSTTAYDLTGQGRIVFAESIRRDDGKEVIRQVEATDKGLKITTKQGGRTLVRLVSPPRDTLAHQRELEAWLQGPRVKGDLFTKYSTSWDETNVNSKQVYQFKESKKILFHGIPTTTYSVLINLDGGKLDAVVLPDARALHGSMGGLLSMKLEKETAAKKLEGPVVDLMPVTSIRVETDLGMARSVEYLKLQLSGLGDFKVPASHRQKISTEKGQTLVELHRDFRPDKPDPLSSDDRKRYTRSTPRLQSDQEPIVSLARKIVGEETDPVKVARKIEAWVYKNLRKSYSDNGETALEILDQKAGDCTEHALLFVALARAVNLPAREVGGLAYVPGDKPSFGWHAWAEFHDGHQWVSVDPTWHQVFVDATHLKMSTGDRDLAWTNVIGTLKMKVLEFKKR